MEIIRVYFCDMPYGFIIDNNEFLNLLNRRHKVIVTKDNPDFLFYGPYANEHLNYSDCVKIFICGEAVSPNFNECDYAVTIEPISYNERHFRWTPLDYTGFSKNAYRTPNISTQSALVQFLNRNFCNFIYSQDTVGKGALLRKRFCKLLMQYKKVDCPGKVLNNMENALLGRYDDGWQNAKVEFLKNYKFTIAFENDEKNEYITEKLADPLYAHSVPIYWGAPDVSQSFNTKAIINVRDFDSMEEVVEYVKYLDTHDDEYLKVLQTYPFIDDAPVWNQSISFEDFIYRIIDKGRHPLEKGPYSIHRSGEKLLFHNTKEVAKLYLEAGNKKKAIEYAKMCLKIETGNRPEIYPILEKAYSGDIISFLELLNTRKQYFMKKEIARPEDLVELCAIARCFVHADEIRTVEEIRDYVLAEDPDSKAVKRIFLRRQCPWLQKNKRYAIWGTGDAGALVADEICFAGGNLTIVVDRDPKKLNEKFYGKDIHFPEYLSQNLDAFDFLIVCHYTMTSDIAKEAMRLGIPVSKMVTIF